MSWLSSVSKQNSWSYRYHGWICRCCRRLISTICCRIMVVFVVVVCQWTLYQWSYYGWFVVVDVRQYSQYAIVLWLVCCFCHRQLTHYVVVIRLDLWLLSSISKHNMWTYYRWVCCCRRSVNTMHAHTGIIVGLVVFIISQ